MGGEERHENVNKKEESEGKGEKEEREMWREKKKKKEEEKRKKRELRGPAYGFLVGPACFRGLFPPSSLLISIITQMSILTKAK